MRITHGGRTYEIQPDDQCWQVCTIEIVDNPKAKTHGQERKVNRVYPGRFDQALRSLLDRMMRDGLEPTADLTAAVATVAHLYRTIGDAVEANV